MGLPTGDLDLQDSEHSSDDENEGGAGEGKTRKNGKGKAAAAAAAAEAAAKAAENSWMGGGGGGGRWGGGGKGVGGGGGGGNDGGEQVAAEKGGKEGGDASARDDVKVAIAVENGGGDVDHKGQPGVEGTAEPATGPSLPSVARAEGAAAKVGQRTQEAGEIYSLGVYGGLVSDQPTPQDARWGSYKTHAYIPWVTTSEKSQAQQGFLSPLIIPSRSHGCRFTADRGGESLFDPFIRVTS